MDVRASGVAVALPRLSRIDVGGATVVVAFVAWTIVSASVAGGDPMPSIGIACASVIAFAIARVFGRRRPTLVPGLVIAVAAVLALAAGADAVNARAEGDPLGYANANAALWVQAAAAGLLLASIRTSIAVRFAGVGAAVVFGALTVVSYSLAAASLLSLVVAGAAVARSERLSRWFVVALAVLVGIALWTTLVLGAGYRFELTRPPSQEIAEESLSTRRLVLWRDAVDLMQRHPISGVGPRRFAQESPIALADSDTTETHNEFLQQGAETGYPGLILMALLTAWVFVRLFGGSPLKAVAAGAAAAAAIHASVDYIFHFPMIPIVVAALVGTACAAATKDPAPRRGPGRRGDS